MESHSCVSDGGLCASCWISSLDHQLGVDFILDGAIFRSLPVHSHKGTAATLSRLHRIDHAPDTRPRDPANPPPCMAVARLPAPWCRIPHRVFMRSQRAYHGGCGFAEKLEENCSRCATRRADTFPSLPGVLNDWANHEKGWLRKFSALARTSPFRSHPAAEGHCCWHSLVTPSLHLIAAADAVRIAAARHTRLRCRPGRRAQNSRRPIRLTPILRGLFREFRSGRLGAERPLPAILISRANSGASEG